MLTIGSCGNHQCTQTLIVLMMPAFAYSKRQAVDAVADGLFRDDIDETPPPGRDHRQCARSPRTTIVQKYPVIERADQNSFLEVIENRFETPAFVVRLQRLHP